MSFCSKKKTVDIFLKFFRFDIRYDLLIFAFFAKFSSCDEIFAFSAKCWSCDKFFSLSWGKLGDYFFLLFLQHFDHVTNIFALASFLQHWLALDQDPWSYTLTASLKSKGKFSGWRWYIVYLRCIAWNNLHTKWNWVRLVVITVAEQSN